MPSDLIRGWVPVFPRDKREAFARRSCSDKKIDRDDDSKKSHPDPERRIAEKINEFAGRAESVLYENRGNITRTFGSNTLPHQLWIDLSVFDLNYLRDFITRHSSGTTQIARWSGPHSFFPKYSANHAAGSEPRSVRKRRSHAASRASSSACAFCRSGEGAQASALWSAWKRSVHCLDVVP
jgi:hypothetical protein